MGEPEYTGVIIFSEDEAISYELVTPARELAAALNTTLSAIFIGVGDTIPKSLIAYGVDKVIAIDYNGQFDVEVYTDLLAAIIGEENPEILIIGGTKYGKELAPRVAARLNKGCATDCIKLSIDKDTRKLTGERIVYGGNGIETVVFNVKPQIVTVPGRTFEAPQERDESRSGEIIHREIEAKVPRVKVIKVSERAIEAVKLEDAEVIVSLGRGVKKKEDITIIEKLAKALGGEVGCSRPIAADLKWLSKDHWVGLSGHKVKPKLYIACGISGQIQHLAGMRDSGLIVAINRDSEAPIFKAADYGIVGDLYKIVPALTETLSKR